MAKNAASMVQRVFDVKLSDAAMMALEEAGQAPEVTVEHWCWDCERKGKITLKIAPKGNREAENLTGGRHGDLFPVSRPEDLRGEGRFAA